MLGPTVNAIVIVICSLVGCFFIRGIPARFEEIIRKAIGLSIIYLGIKGALENQRVLLLFMSMVGGAAIGELINLDALMNRLGVWAEKKITKASEKGGDNGIEAERSFSKGFISASILYCSGSMAIVGSIQSGLMNDHKILFAKSFLDGAFSLVFAASMGIGVAFSAVPVFVYQAGIALGSMALRSLLTPEIIREMSAVGNLIVAAIGFNFLSIKEIMPMKWRQACFSILLHIWFVR